MKLSHALSIRSGDVLALTGGGGKTTAMFRLANELAQQPLAKLRVLMTTSTRIFAAQIKRAPAHVTFNPGQQSTGEILSRLDEALDQHSRVLLIGQAELASG